MTHSPCTKVCKIKEGICTGCHRTLEQIGAWGSMTDKERQEAMRELKWPVAVVDRVGIMQRLSPYTNLPEGTKLYTHPASAEVDRLQERLAELEAAARAVVRAAPPSGPLWFQSEQISRLSEAVANPQGKAFIKRKQAEAVEAIADGFKECGGAAKKLAMIFLNLRAKDLRDEAENLEIHYE